MKKLMFWVGLGALLFIAAPSFSSTTFAQTTAFTYQGSLTYNGSPANGAFDFEFKLFDALTAGNQVETTVVRSNVNITNGVFAVSIDFGSAAFPGADRYLEVSARPNPCGNLPLPPCTFSVLQPRSQLHSTPYAIRARTVTGPVTATSLSAALSVGNDQPGISNPSPTNLPPAALRAEATSTVDTNAGVIAIANGTGGFGVLGITNGSGTSPQKTYGVVGLSTSPTGSGAGLSGISNSPNSAAIEAEANGGGLIFNGKSSDTSSSNPKFVVTAIGQVRANGSVFARGFQSNSGTFGVTEAGNLGAVTVEAGTITSTGNLNVGGLLSAPNVNIGGGGGSLSVGSISTTGNVTIGGTLGGNGGNIQLGANNIFTSGSVNSFNSTVGGSLSVSGPISVGQGGTINGVLNTGPLNSGGIMANGNVQVNGILTVTGAKNNVIELKNGRAVVLYANESPEYWFEDFGTIQLKNGRAIVTIDPVFAEAVNTSVPYKVFLTPNGNTRGLYVIRKTATSFEVRENGRGRSNVSFDYRIVVKRRGYEGDRFGPVNGKSRPNAKEVNK